MVNVREDAQGGWNRLKTKFECNNIHFDGGSAPAGGREAIRGAIDDLVRVCSMKGVVVTHPP